MSDGGFIRLAPERPTVSFTAEEAVDAARAAFGDARRAYGDAQTSFGYLSGLLFKPTTVTCSRLRSMRAETREVINRALAVEAALSRAIEAMESTRPDSTGQQR